MKKVNITMPPDMHYKLQFCALKLSEKRKQKVTVSSLIREAVTQFLEDLNKFKQG